MNNECENCGYIGSDFIALDADYCYETRIFHAVLKCPVCKHSEPLGDLNKGFSFAANH